MIVNAINPEKCMMVPDKVGNAVNLLSEHTEVRKEYSNHVRPLFFLMLATSVAILLTAQWAGNIVGDCCNLKDILGVSIQSL